VKGAFFLAPILLLSNSVNAQTIVPFVYTGSLQTWTVPTGVTSITIDAGGAQGGGDAQNITHALGGRVQATYTVTPGTVLNIYVGGAGVDGSIATTSASAGGYNGGGTAGYYSISGYSGGGGGGATDIRIGGTALSNRVLVAGGGGGGGYIASAAAGGAGGNTTGGDGATGDGITAATGGTPSSGGSGGTYGVPGDYGSDGAPGMGGNASTADGIPGGGGGGYYGGGGGATNGAGPGGGGGGGSSYTDPSMTGLNLTQGYNSGNGYLNITYMPAGGTIAFVNGSPQNMAAICENSGAAPINSLLTASDNTAGETLTWTVVSGPSLGTLGGFNATATSIVGNSTPTDLTYTPTSSDFGTDAFTIQVSNGVNSVTATVNVTINELPSVSSVSSQTVCNNTNTAAITFSGSLVAGTAYNWTNSDNTIGLGSGSTGNIASFIATNATSSINTATITVTPSANGCNGASQSFNITIDPTPSVNSVSSQTVCNNTSTAAIIFSGSPVVGTAYNWTNSDNTIGLASGSSGVIVPFIATNATSSIKTATVTVTPTANSCNGVSKSFTITVNPTPNVAAIDDTAICNGTSYSVTFNGSSVSNTSYAWTNSNTATGLGASGTDTTGIFITSNAGSTNDTSTIIVTPKANGCNGIPDTFMMAVYPVPNVTATDDTSLCNGTSYSAAFGGSLVMGTSYLWTNSNASTGLAASGTDATGTVTLTNLNTATDASKIIVTPRANGCNGIPDTFMVNVYPTPMLTGSLIRSAICDNTVFSYGDTSLTPGTSFAWTMPSVSGISAPATSGVDSINEVLSNSTTAQAMVTFVYTLTANGCVNTENVIVTVNPTPQLNSATSNVQCDSQVFSYAPSSLTNDSSFAWIRLYVEGIDSLAGSGTGAINDLLINTTSVNVTDTYKYIITAYGCSDTELVTVTVHPTPMLSSATSSLAVCSGQAFNYLPESLSGSAVTYSWIRDSVAGITPALGSGMGAINETLVNFTSSPQTVPYSYTLLAYGCTNTETVYLTVNPLPLAPAITTYVSNVCDNAQNQNFGVATPAPGYESYYWSSPNATVQQGPTGQYSIVNFTEPGTATVMVTVTVDSTQCYSTSSLNVTVGDGTADQPYVVYSFGEFVCLENNVTSYQWGYDSKATLDSTILGGQINQNYANSNPDTVHNYYWVITGQNGCFMKSYYNGPSTTAISNVNEATNVTVYPNPTSNYINIDINSTVGGDVTIGLSNMLGQKMNEVPAKDNKATIDVSNLASGVYVIDCYRGGVKIAAAKFIKN